MVAEDDVVPGPTGQGVGPCSQPVGIRRGAGVDRRHRQRAGAHVDVDAGVTEHEVAAAVARDGVGARPARQHVRCLAADDRVVAGAAVRDHADGPAGAGNRRGVDDVVTAVANGDATGTTKRGALPSSWVNGFEPMSATEIAVGLPAYQEPLCPVSPYRTSGETAGRRHR